jgi:hypothetical protein
MVHLARVRVCMHVGLEPSHKLFGLVAPTTVDSLQEKSFMVTFF